MCRHYRWSHDFWRRMGRNEFYAWVDQAGRESSEQKADDPHSWKGTDEDEWWQQARAKRRERQGR